MAQHDMNIANQGFPAFRSDLNDALAALVSNSSGATEPSTTFAHQMWVDTAADPSILKIRNADNDAWITIGSLNQTDDKFKLTPADGVSTDTISELTSAAGVTIDGVLLKDTTVTANTIKASGTSSTQGEVQLFEDTDNGTNYVAIKAPASIASNVTWTLPNADGTADQVLKTDGSGSLGWASAGGASNLGDGSATTPSVNFASDTNTGIYRPGNDRLGFATNGALVGEFNGTNLQFDSGYGSVATAYGCRAWVNFNGTGTVAIREDGNVSSVTDRGTGLYTLNFTTAMPDANYCGVASATIGGAANTNRSAAIGPVNTSSAYCNAWISDTGNGADVEVICAAIFR
jgi:hypothetical protein